MGAPQFRVSIRKEVWETTQTTLYRQYGRPDHRELIAAKHTTSTLALGPGFTQGDYVLIQYRRPFHSGTVLETLVMKRERDDWRPARYNIRTVSKLALLVALPSIVLSRNAEFQGTRRIAQYG